MGTSAGLAGVSWAEALPRLTADDLAVRRRIGPLVERLGRWGPLYAAALPRALEGLWPAGPADAAGPVLRVELSGPEADAQELLLDRFPVRIGRGEGCTLQLPSPAVSTEHAELRVTDGDRLFLMDLRSTNGTKRNGQPLVPLDAVELVPGDVVEIGPFVLVPESLAPVAPEQTLEIRAAAPSLRDREALFLTSHSSDRWVQVRWAEETAWLRVPAAWIRSAWQRASDLPPGEGDDVDPMEEGAAQYVLVQAARALSRETGHDLDLSDWLTPEEVRRAAPRDGPWLGSEVRLRAHGSELVTELVFPVPEPAPLVRPDALADLLWPATVCLGLVRLTVSEWRGLDTGDALVPDVWWPAGWREDLEAPVDDLGPAFVRVRRAWHGGRLLRSEAGVTLRLDSPWLDTPGGEWLMAEDDALGAATPSSLPVDDLELQVAIELDRFPVTLGELQRWRAGEVLTLRQSPSDPVRLVVETGLQRRVLAEGRVVLVNDRLGIELVRILTRFEDSTPHR